ncbi:hypothetical protein [Paenibacillus xylaniclasticus]|uniref:hypothetical protein n=1 Tax=Paenibacillus xylaniclasticus TaxID=588083 RepID=UPI0017591F0A|nr:MULTISPECIES: hypothetical protein [Paenibacillus]GFN30712.1 hypothetical protein PCURB6_09720 [Paenibacillus curdlanolyticus]
MRSHPLARVTAAFVLLLLIVTAANPAYANAADAKAKSPHHPVQVFDVKAERVVKSVNNDKQYQKFARSWLKSITGLAPQLQADEQCQYVYRVPLQKQAKVKLAHTELVVKEVFLFKCDGKPPLLLVFDEQRRPYLLLFSADIQPFIARIGIPS